MNLVMQKVLDMLIGTGSQPDSRRVILPRNGASRPLKRFSERQLIQQESRIGTEIFGPVPAGHRREFFNLDASTWIWYDEWTDNQTHTKQTVTIRYEVHENGILKVREGARYSFLKDVELDNFVSAVDAYYERVCKNIYKRNPLHPSQQPTI